MQNIERIIELADKLPKQDGIELLTIIAYELTETIECYKLKRQKIQDYIDERAGIPKESQIKSEPTQSNQTTEYGC